MCNCKSPSDTCAAMPERNFGGFGPVETDYAGNNGGHWRPVTAPASDIRVDRAIASEDLKEMDDEQIAELTADASRESFERLIKTRDELVESEFRQESHDEATDAFRYHPADTKAKADAHEQVRGSCAMLAHRLIDLCPPSTQVDIALVKLREAMFWANAAVALG